MTRDRASRSGEARRTGQGSVAIRRCPICGSSVLSAFRGEVTAVGKAEIVSVTREGDVIGQCACGKRVIWQRQIERPAP